MDHNTVTKNDDDSDTENKTLEYAKEVALDFTATAATTLGVVAGVLIAGYVYQKALDFRAARRLKKETKLEPVHNITDM